MSPSAEQYARLLRHFVLEEQPELGEQRLSEAFELGRQFVEQAVPPDELVLIHHQALMQLAHCKPDIAFADVAEKISAPLLEMTMAYGLAFRQQAEDKLNRLVRERYQHTSRLQAVATLAAGIAHDFNNIIGGIWGYAEMLHEDAQDDQPSRLKLEQIMKGCGRARDLVDRMLTFARQQPGQPTPTHLNQQVREALELLSPFLKASISLSFTETADAIMVHSPPGALQQLVMNLCLNANDAIARAGTIRVELSVNQSSQACLKVRDDGSGMPPEILEQIYHPFFTTKEPGSGSGLGLSVVHGIMTDLGGQIEVHSECAGVHRGTEFSLFIPIEQPSTPLERPRTTHYGPSTAD